MAPTDDEKRKNQDGPSPDRPKKRVNKPLIEKRRRERINECLNQLQTLISQLDKDKYKVGRPAKLEKADILEMTVEFVRKTKTNLQVNPKEDADLHEQSYVAGYRKCMDEIQTFCKDNNVPTELKASLHDQIDLKIRQIKMEEDTAVDLSTKTDKKDSKLTEQMQVFANSNPAIQPKSLPQISTANSAQMTQVQLIQRPLNANGQLTVVCQKEPSTYVLVPAATICQPIQIPSASQNLPVILQNGAQNCELKSNMEKSGHIFPAANMLQNTGQLLMLPNSQFSIPMMNTSLSSSITLSSGYKPLPSESSFVVSTPHLPIVSSSLMSVSGAGIPTPSTHLMSTSGSSMFKQIQPSIPPHTVNGQFHNITNDLGNQIQNNNLHNDNMWRPW